MLFISVQIIFYMAGTVYLKGTHLLGFGIFKSQNIDRIDMIPLSPNTLHK